MTGLIRELTQDWFGRIILALVVFLVGFLLGLPFVALQAAEEQKQWEVFAVEHQCHVVASTPGTTTMSPIMVGKSLVLVPQTHPGRTTYLCNNERTYTR